MESRFKLWIAIAVLLSCTVTAQIKNSKTTTITIYGNCDKCKASIEKAGSMKKIAKVDWNKNTKIATITYNTQKTTLDKILKHIALSGYDNERFLSPDNIYARLPNCCRYDRIKKMIAKMGSIEHQTGYIFSTTMERQAEQVQEKNQLHAIFEHYFSLKDALITTDETATSTKAKALQTAIRTVQTDTLSHEEYTVWMSVINDLDFDAEHIATAKDATHQKDYFMRLSKSMYALMKVSTRETPTYYQYCPMANDGKGAHWLSKERAIKNPYYGSQMLSCGKVIEILR